MKDILHLARGISAADRKIREAAFSARTVASASDGHPRATFEELIRDVELTLLSIEKGYIAKPSGVGGGRTLIETKDGAKALIAITTSNKKRLDLTLSKDSEILGSTCKDGGGGGGCSGGGGDSESGGGGGDGGGEGEGDGGGGGEIGRASCRERV